MDNNKIVDKIISYIDKVISYTENIDYDKFISDGLVQDACFMNLTQIGENVVKLDDDFISKYKDIKWNEMKGLRNRIVHDYDGVEIQIIWDTIKDDLPKLKKQLQTII